MHTIKGIGPVLRAAVEAEAARQEWLGKQERTRDDIIPEFRIPGARKTLIREDAKQAFEAASTAATEGIKEVVREDDEDPGRQRVFLGWWVTQLNAGRDMSATFRYRRQHGSAA